MGIVSLNVWDQILERLELRVGAANFSTWLKPTSLGRLDGDTLSVQVPNATFSDWIQANYRPLIDETIAELGLPVRIVEFSPTPAGNPAGLLADGEPERPFRVAGDSPAAVAGPAPSAPDTFLPATMEHSVSSPLNSRYVFSSFVVGSSNQFAHAAASRVAADPGRSYNPLFLYGGVGLGKTHLMQAIGHTLSERFPRWQLLYISAERFTNEMVQSLMDGKMPGFHQRFRSVDALLVDDVQFLSGKERIQEEFFYTFNALYERQRQIVLSSDRPPKEIQVEERLRSRFASGLIADIQPPDLETRQAILMKMAEAERFPLPEKIALFIATNVKSNIRELEGSLVRLIAFASLTGEDVNEAMARQALKDLVETEPKRVSIELIQKTVCEFFNLRLQELKAKDNSKRIVVPRQVAMWLARELTQSSLPEIARAFGDKHHTTVLHSISKISNLRTVDKDLNRAINKLLASFE